MENSLNNLRINCVLLSQYHKDEYYRFKGLLKYFRLPTIVLSAVNSVFSVGLQPFVLQQNISIINCLISLVCGIINSFELFLGIQNTMENALNNSKDFYLLSIDLYKVLALEPENRSDHGKEYLEEKYSCYCKLIESSTLINSTIIDRLIPIDNKELTIRKVIDIVSNVNNNVIERNIVEETNLNDIECVYYTGFNENTQIDNALQIDNDYDEIPLNITNTVEFSNV